MNLSIHLALTLNSLLEIDPSLLWNEPILFSLFLVLKILKMITNTRPKYLEDSSDQTNNCQQSCFFFLQVQRILINLYVGHRFRIV